MRERLIELIKESFDKPKYEFYTGGRNCAKGYVSAKTIADYLLDNGVIAPPCKVGDTVWGYWINDGIIMIDELYIMSEMQAIVMKDLWGKKVFATKKQAQEEAEARLEELKNEQERRI